MISNAGILRDKSVIKITMEDWGKNGLSDNLYIPPLSKPVPACDWVPNLLFHLQPSLSCRLDSPNPPANSLHHHKSAWTYFRQQNYGRWEWTFSFNLLAYSFSFCPPYSFPPRGKESSLLLQPLASTATLDKQTTQRVSPCTSCYILVLLLLCLFILNPVYIFS